MTTATQQIKRATRLTLIRDGIRKFFMDGDFIAFVLLLLLLLVLPLSLDVAEWPVEQSVLIPTVILSVIAGFVLSRSQFNEFFALLISMTYGFATIILLGASQLDVDGGIYAIFERIGSWVIDATTGGINQDNAVFTMLVGLLFWFLGYSGAWHTFRIDRVWRVIAPPGIILTSNVVFYSGTGNLERYMLIYIFLAMLIVVRHNLDAREWEWYINGIHRPPQLRRQFLWVGVLLAMLPLLVGASVPNANLQERLDNFQNFLQSDPLTQMSEFWSRMFSPIEAAGPTTADYYGGESLQLGGAIRLGDQDVLLVDAPTQYRYYWKSRVFDTYEGGRWLPASEVRLTDSVAPFTADLEPDKSRIAVEQNFTIALNATRIIYAAPQAFEVDMPARADIFYTAAESDPSRHMNISVIRPLKVIRRGDDYTATSLMSMATAHDLRAAGTAYPEWVATLYLYVSGSVTQRTMDLARQVVAEAGAVTPYDQAKAIESFLRTHIAYNESIPSPPVGRDPIDWVLFDHRQGYCNYYASSMIVMLRSLGIPARMAAGFAEGTYDNEQGVYVVTERDAHTWVEVYFPGYGWIEFEPTAAQEPLDREGDEVSIQNPMQEDLPTATPTITPSPLPTATPLPTNTPPPEDPDNPLPTAIPTITPTFTPTATATPVIIPTQPPPMEPEPNNPLALIMPAIGMFLLGVLVLLLIILTGVFIWWWWEWRGMRGLSPITRAYARLDRYVSLIGIRHNAQDTTQERSKRMVSILPRAKKAIIAIVKLYTEERYGDKTDQPGLDERNATVVDRAWVDARGDIIKRWGRRFMPWAKDTDDEPKDE